MAINTGIGVTARRIRGLRTACECPKLPGTARENYYALCGRRPVLCRKSAWRRRLIQHKRGRDAIIAQPAYESRCFPVAVWHLIDEPFALRSPAIKAGHLGGGSGLIDEDKLLRIKG